MPIRVRLSREKGWRMPPNTVKVARPTRWGNPFKIGNGVSHDARMAVALYRAWLEERMAKDRPGATYHSDQLMSLRGKNLACFCSLDQPCHADVLLELANR
jgi:hypothetical protein